MLAHSWLNFGSSSWPATTYAPSSSLRATFQTPRGSVLGRGCDPAKAYTTLWYGKEETWIFSCHVTIVVLTGQFYCWDPDSSCPNSSDTKWMKFHQIKICFYSVKFPAHICVCSWFHPVRLQRHIVWCGVVWATAAELLVVGGRKNIFSSEKICQWIMNKSIKPIAVFITQVVGQF